MPRIVETDNFDGDYPDESFVLPFRMSKEEAQIIASYINDAAGEHSKRYWKVVEDNYQLQPGFEP